MLLLRIQCIQYLLGIRPIIPPHYILSVAGYHSWIMSYIPIVCCTVLLFVSFRYVSKIFPNLLSTLNIKMIFSFHSPSLDLIVFYPNFILSLSLILILQLFSHSFSPFQFSIPSICKHILLAGFYTHLFPHVHSCWWLWEAGRGSWPQTRCRHYTVHNCWQ